MKNSVFSTQFLKPLLYSAGIIIALYLGYLLGGKPTTEQENLSNTKHNQPTENMGNSKKTEKENQQAILNDTLSANHDITNTLITDNVQQSVFEKYISALIQSDYSKAMQIYHNALQADPNTITLFKKQFIEHILLLLKQSPQDSSRIESALDSYLADFYDDIDILLLLAQHHIKNYAFYDALLTLQLADSYSYNNKQKQQTIKTYKSLIANALKTYIPQNDWYSMLDIYATAESMGLIQEEDIFNLIKLHSQNDNPYQARQYAEALASKPEWTEKVQQLLEELQPDTKPTPHSVSSNIPLTKINDQFIISVGIDRTTTSLLIDTGASITTISKATYDAIVSQLNSRFIKNATFSTANGKTTGTLYQVDQFTIGEYTINDTVIAVLDFPTSQHYSGLLGMNILSQFRFEIDQKNSTLVIEKN